MTTEKKKTCAASRVSTTAWLLITGIALYWIVAEPDAGGIWDGYVPTWLGGEGPDGPGVVR